MLSAIDGDTATSWGCCFHDVGLSEANYLLDLQSVYFVDAVKIHSELTSFDLLVSSEDNVGTYTSPVEVSWQQVEENPTIITNGGTILYIDQSVRHIRVRIPNLAMGFASCVGIKEIELALS